LGERHPLTISAIFEYRGAGFAGFDSFHAAFDSFHAACAQKVRISLPVHVVVKRLS